MFNSAKRLKKSFLAACAGLALVTRQEQNFRIQLAGAVIAILFAFYFPLFSWQKIAVILLVVMVLTMELLNTVVEKFADLLKPRLSGYVETIKDLMAAAVLVTSLGALVVGLMIFLPHFINLLG